jgi:transposase
MNKKVYLTLNQINKLLTRFTQKELADILEVNEKTIRRRKKPNNKSPQRREPKLKIDRIGLLCLRIYTALKKVTTQKSLANHFSQWSGKTISQPTICRALKKLKITYKKASYHSSEQLRQKNKERIKEFINTTLPSLPQSRVFFLDECSFRLNTAPRYAYSPQGSRAIVQKPGNKGTNYTFIFLAQITNGKKIIHSKLIKGGVNSESFHNFLSEINLPTNDKYYLVMDNLRVHKATNSCIKLGLTTIKELLESKNIEPIYLPAYTPELNPVEKCFNITRQYIESNQPRKKVKLDYFIQERLEFFHKEDLTKYLKNSIQECLTKLSSEEDINETIPRLIWEELDSRRGFYTQKTYQSIFDFIR